MSQLKRCMCYVVCIHCGGWYLQELVYYGDEVLRIQFSAPTALTAIRLDLLP